MGDLAPNRSQRTKEGSKAMGSKKVDALVAKLRKDGAAVVKRGQRWRVTQAGKELCFLPIMDPHAKGLENKVADLRRKGYVV
jgi:hypothetical protein